MARTITQILYIIIFIFFSPLIASSATYYVDASCPSSGNGTTATCGANGPWRTLGEAASNVPNNANHTISVAAGTYSGFTDNRSGTSPGYRYWLANGNVSITSTVTINGSWVKFDGFTITGPMTSCFMTSSTTSNGWFTNLTISRCTYGADINGTDNLVTSWDFSNCSDYWHVFGSGHTFRGNYVHNHITGNGSFHSDVWQTWDDQYHSAAQNVTVEKNHIFLGDDSTGHLSDESISYSIHVFMWEDSATRHASGLTVRNNIFESIGGLNATGGHLDGLRVYNNLFRNDYNIARANSGPGLIVYNAYNVEVKNNMFIDGTQAVSFTNVTNATNAANLFWRSDGRSTSNMNYSSSGDIVNQNPLFVYYDKAVYNLTTAYNLQFPSPAKDTGPTVAVTDDFAGTSRPQGSAYDIGPYEFETGTPAAPTGLKVISTS
jgi:hypothetical protein